MLLSMAIEEKMSKAIEQDRPDGELHRLSRDFNTAKEIEKAIEVLGNAVNGHDFGFVAAAVFGELQRTHRYLQGEIGRVIMSVLKRYAELDENQYDARNEWVIKAAREIDEKTPYLIR